MQNSRLIQACFPIKIDEIWIDRFCVRYDWWRRLQRTSSVSPVWVWAFGEWRYIFRNTGLHKNFHCFAWDSIALDSLLTGSDKIFTGPRLSLIWYPDIVCKICLGETNKSYDLLSFTKRNSTLIQLIRQLYWNDPSGLPWGLSSVWPLHLDITEAWQAAKR